jgi:hypothetical protein
MTEARSRAPVTVSHALPEHLPAINRWLADAAIYEEAFMLAAEPDPAWIAASMLLVKNNLRTEFQPVRFWSVLDRQQQLIGLGIDYGWEHSDDTDRELDFALPGSTRGNARVPLWTLSLIIDRLFQDHGATSVWGRVRIGASGKGFPRMFAAIGAEAEQVRWDLQPTSGEKLPRVYYRTTPDSFYASGMGKRVRAPALP